MYVDSLIGPDTVNSMTPATYDAYKHHGKPRVTITENLDQAHDQLAALKQAVVDLGAVTDQLESEGVKSFSKSFDILLAVITTKLDKLQTRGVRAAGLATVLV